MDGNSDEAVSLANRIGEERSRLLLAIVRLEKLADEASLYSFDDTNEDVSHAIGTLRDVCETLETRSILPMG